MGEAMEKRPMKGVGEKAFLHARIEAQGVDNNIFREAEINKNWYEMDSLKVFYVALCIIWINKILVENLDLRGCCYLARGIEVEKHRL